MLKQKRGTSSHLRIALIALSVTIGSTGFSAADVNLKLNDVIKEMSIKGDLRVRHESFHRPDQNGRSTANASTNRNRHRQRYRLRLGMDFKLPHNMEVKTRLASGTGEQVSTNQSLDGLSGQKSIWVDQAYLKWSPFDALTLAAGKTNNPFWTPYSSDVIWDGDFNPEGAYQQFQFYAPLKSRIFINALQMVADEDRSGTADQGLFSQQIGVETLLFEESKFTGAFAVHEWVNEKMNNFGTLVNDEFIGNRRVGSVSTGTLTNNFRVVEYTGEYATRLANMPLSFQGTLVANVKADLSPRENSGFQYGLIAGKAKEKNSFEAAYFYKRVETDATVADVADSDFGSVGGTNRKGHIVWGAWAPTSFSKFSLKHFVTRKLNVTLAPTSEGTKQVHRTQVDFQISF